MQTNSSSGGIAAKLPSKADFQIPHLWIASNPNSPPNPSERVSCLVVLTRPVSTLSLPRAFSDHASPPHAILLLCACSPHLSAELFKGLLLVASLLWEGRDRKNSTLRLTKAMGLRFVSGLSKGVNPVTFVCKAWGCALHSKGSSINGNKTNLWSFPSWADGQTLMFQVVLTPHQRKRWNNRDRILIECSNKANPPAALVRETLALTEESVEFKRRASALTTCGKIQTVRAYRKNPTKINITRDGDIQSVVSRLPEELRSLLLIGGCAVAEFDIKSAHAVLLAMFYKDETGEDWAAEQKRFVAEGRAGFLALYGAKKEHKKAFLSALNQLPMVGRHASHGYREFERLFPLLAGKTARIRWLKPKALGSILRNRLAIIMREVVKENHADGIRSIPVVDSLLVPMPKDPKDLWGQHRAAFRTAWRLAVPLAKLTGIPSLIEGSDGVSYRFTL